MIVDTDLLTDMKEIREKLEDNQGLFVLGEWERTLILGSVQTLW